MNAARKLHAEGRLDAAAQKLDLLLSRPPITIYWPHPDDIQEELAIVRQDQGRFEDALREVNAIIDRSPDYLDVYVTRIDIYCAMKDWNEVLKRCEEILDRLKDKKKLESFELKADYLARQYHAVAWTSLGEFQFAEDELRTLIKFAPTDRRNYTLLADVFAGKKDYKQALEYFDKAYQLHEPDWDDPEDVNWWCLAAQPLAELLATCPDASVRDGQRAKQIVEKVLAKSDRFPFVKTTLAAAYAELGDFDKAVEIQSEVMAQPLLHVTGSHQQARLECYKRKEPFRYNRSEDP
jgi:tetratricopeptide (TPR) repeat protein